MITKKQIEQSINYYNTKTLSNKHNYIYDTYNYCTKNYLEHIKNTGKTEYNCELIYDLSFKKLEKIFSEKEKNISVKCYQINDYYHNEKKNYLYMTLFENITL